MSYATCENPDCGNYDIPIDVGPLSYVDEETGETRTISEVVCGGVTPDGPCGQEITNITDDNPNAS